MPKSSSAKYYQNNKDYKKKLIKDIKVPLKKKKKNINNKAVNNRKIQQKLKSKTLLSKKNKKQ